MAEYLLEVKDLCVAFHSPKGTIHAVKNVSFHLEKGETLAILGESGSGKSVSASAIMGILDMPPAKISKGQVLLEGQDLLNTSEQQRQKINGPRIAMIFQDPLGHLNPVYSVGWQIEEAMRVHGTDKTQAHTKMLSLLEKVGIPFPDKAAKKYPHQFSGGQRQRIMIAMALTMKPDLLIADEPTTALDVTVQAQILVLLNELQKETGMGLLIITHDLGVVADIADRVVVMNDGCIVETGSIDQVYHSPVHPYTKKLIAAAPGNGVMSNSSKQNEIILQVQNLSKEYEGFMALNNVSFNLAQGETLAIVGESGSGKSTTANLIMGLEKATSGAALYCNRDLFTMSKEQLRQSRRDIQMVFQDPSQSLNPRMSVYQIISEPWIIHPQILDKQHWLERVAQLLLQVGLSTEHMHRYPHQFSGGQRQRIAIARALAVEPKIIVCDEAVSALDVSIQAQVIDLLSTLQQALNISFIFIAHDLPVVRDFADRVMVMQFGKVVELGPVKQIFENPQQTYTRSLLEASLDPDPRVQAARRAQRADLTATAAI